MTSELLENPALDLAALVRAGEVSARALVEAALRRIEATQESLNAFGDVQAEQALLAAAAIAPGDRRPFAGVPIALKDSVAQRDAPCRLGAALFRDFRPGSDSATVRRLREAGFVIVGRTTMPELGILSTTEPRLTGQTRNPWDPERTPGGSSGGSAVAVAAGAVPIAHGGDGAGSLRIPAACCGLVGLKPSRGRVSRFPQAGDDSWVVEGGLTRTVADAAALLDVLSGDEPSDATWAPPPAQPFLEWLRRSLREPPRRLRVGLALDPPLPAPLDESCAWAATQAAELLEELGHVVEEMRVPPLSAQTRRAFDEIWAVLAAEGVERGGAVVQRTVTPEDVEPLTWALYVRGRRLDALAYRAAHAELQRAAREVVTALLRYDVVVTPALAEPPVPLGTITGFEQPDPLRALARSDRFSPYTVLWSMTGQPAVSVPLCEHPRGLPLAVQLVGSPGGDDVLLAIAGQLEQARPWAHRRPPRPSLPRRG